MTDQDSWFRIRWLKYYQLFIKTVFQMISLRAHLNIQQSPTNSNMKTNQINPLKTLQLLF